MTGVDNGWLTTLKLSYKKKSLQKIQYLSFDNTRDIKFCIVIPADTLYKSIAMCTKRQPFLSQICPPLHTEGHCLHKQGNADFFPYTYFMFRDLWLTWKMITKGHNPSSLHQENIYMYIYRLNYMSITLFTSWIMFCFCQSALQERENWAIVQWLLTIVVQMVEMRPPRSMVAQTGTPATENTDTWTCRVRQRWPKRGHQPLEIHTCGHIE